MAAAYKKAVLNVTPYKMFFEAFANKKVPSPAPMRELLINTCSVPEGSR